MGLIEQLEERIEQLEREIENLKTYTKVPEIEINPYEWQKTNEEPCMFDYFDPKEHLTLGLVCKCPKCSPRC